MVFRILTHSSDFWPKYTSERLRNYLEKQVLEPICAVLVPLSPCLLTSMTLPTGQPHHSARPGNSRGKQGWGPARVGAQSGLGPGPGWGPYEPIRALMSPPGQVLAGPDMSDFRLFVEFCMFWFQNLLFEVISSSF